MKAAILGFLGISLLVAVIGVFWWLTSPYYTLQVIGESLKDRDAQRFSKCVDVRTIITTLTSEIIYEPALKTPRLSSFQMTVVNSAIGIGKDSIDRALINRLAMYFRPSIRSYSKPINDLASIDNVPSKYKCDEQNRHEYEEQRCADREAYALVENADEHRGYMLADNTGVAIGQFAKELGRELTGETSQLKQQVYQRMIHHAEAHRDTLIGAIFAAPTRGMPAQAMLEQYGLEWKQIKSLTFGGSDTEQTGTLVFYSPKVGHNVSLWIDLVRPSGDMFGLWQIRKFRDLRQTFLDLGEDTDRQVQDMVAYSVEGMTQQNVFKETGNVLKRLSKTDAAKNLMDSIKSRLR